MDISQNLKRCDRGQINSRHHGECEKFYPSEKPSPHLRVTGECAQNERARTVRVAVGGVVVVVGRSGVEAKSSCTQRVLYPGLFDTGTFYFEPQSIDGVTEEDFEKCRCLSMRFHNAGALHRPVWNLRLQPHNSSMK